MEFELDHDQQELQRVVRDVVGRECPPELVRAVVAGGDGDDLWRTVVGLDWPGLTVPVDDGGSGLTAVELVITLEELGWAADPTPFLATTSQYLPLVQECLDGEARRSRRAAVCAGRPGTVAFAAPAVRAEPGDDGWVLHGTAGTVVDGDRADEVLVVAALPACAGSVGVFGVPGGDGAVTRAPAFDGSLHVADLVLGQKVWTSGAHDADFFLAFVRTDPDAPSTGASACWWCPPTRPASPAGRSGRSSRPTTRTSTRCSSTTSRCRRRTWSAPSTRGGGWPTVRWATSGP